MDGIETAHVLTARLMSEFDRRMGAMYAAMLDLMKGGAAAAIPPPPSHSSSAVKAPPFYTGPGSGGAGAVRTWSWGPGTADHSPQDWMEYDAATSAVLEAAYQAALNGVGPVVHTFNVPGHGLYELDFSRMRQINQDTRYERQVRADPAADPVVARPPPPPPAVATAPDAVDREHGPGPITRQWSWNGPGPVGPTMGYVPYDYDQVKCDDYDPRLRPDYDPR